MCVSFLPRRGCWFCIFLVGFGSDVCRMCASHASLLSWVPFHEKVSQDGSFSYVCRFHSSSRSEILPLDATWQSQEGCNCTHRGVSPPLRIPVHAPVSLSLRGVSAFLGCVCSYLPRCLLLPSCSSTPKCHGFSLSPLFPTQPQLPPTMVLRNEGVVKVVKVGQDPHDLGGIRTWEKHKRTLPNTTNKWSETQPWEVGEGVCHRPRLASLPITRVHAA